MTTENNDESWIEPIRRYLVNNEIPYDKNQARKVIIQSSLYTLDAKVLRVGYYWPTIRVDCLNWVRKCNKCQRFAKVPHTPPEILHSVHAP